MANKYITRQLSIFAPNVPGSLAKIAKIFQDTGVNVSGFCIAEAQNFGVVRAIVDKPDAAFSAFERENYLLKFTDVLVVQMLDVPGGLYEVASRFGELNLNITYAYAAKSENRAGPAEVSAARVCESEFIPTLVVHISNTDIALEEAAQKIQSAGLSLVPAGQQSP